MNTRALALRNPTFDQRIRAEHNQYTSAGMRHRYKLPKADSRPYLPARASGWYYYNKSARGKWNYIWYVICGRIDTNKAVKILVELDRKTSGVETTRERIEEKQNERAEVISLAEYKTRKMKTLESRTHFEEAATEKHHDFDANVVPFPIFPRHVMNEETGAVYVIEVPLMELPALLQNSNFQEKAAALDAIRQSIRYMKKSKQQDHTPALVVMEDSEIISVALPVQTVQQSMPMLMPSNALIPANSMNAALPSSNHQLLCAQMADAVKFTNAPQELPAEQPIDVPLSIQPTTPVSSTIQQAFPNSPSPLMLTTPALHTETNQGMIKTEEYADKNAFEYPPSARAKARKPIMADPVAEPPQN